MVPSSCLLYFSRVQCCQVSIMLWFPVWHQDHEFLMLARCWGYHYQRSVYHAEQSVLKCLSVLIHIFLQGYFPQGLTDLAPLKKHKNITQNFTHGKYNNYTSGRYSFKQAYNIYFKEGRVNVIQHKRRN